MALDGGQVTKPIIYVLVKICYKLLYVIQGVENGFGKVANFLASADIRVFGRTYLNIASDWPCTFLCPGVLFSIFLKAGITIQL